VIKINGLEIEDHFTEWGYGWEAPDDELGGPVRILAENEGNARNLAHRAGGSVFVREVFSSAWTEAPDAPEAVAAVA